jgi:hypothetical protein
MVIYNSNVEDIVRKSFQAVQDHNYDAVLQGVSSKNSAFPTFLQILTAAVN